MEPELFQLERELNDATYQPRPYRTFSITKPKHRTISAAAFRDRVVHHALCRSLKPNLEASANEHSYACRVGKGSHAAVAYVQRMTRQAQYFLKLDVEHFFETMDHDVLKLALNKLFDDEKLLRLTNQFVDHGAPGSPEGKGQPIGNLTSQHFANFYLTPADHRILGLSGIQGYCRYMDDMILFANEKETAWEWTRVLKPYFDDVLKLQLKKAVTLVAPIREGIPFLGFRIWPHLIRMDGQRVRRFRRHSGLTVVALGTTIPAIVGRLIAITTSRPTATTMSVSALRAHGNA